MFSHWTKSAIAVVSAALISLAVLPAVAQSDPPPAEEMQTQNPPSEVQEVRPAQERMSTPRYTDDTPQALKLRSENKKGRRCRSGADTEAEAVEECSTQLNCPTGTTVKCQYRQNHRDWICSCK